MTQLSIVLDALKIAEKHLAYVEITEAIAIVKQMMQAEPVAWRSQLASGSYTYCNTPEYFDNAEPIYATPVAPQAMPAWKTIESAPHSADHVLALSATGNIKIETGYWLNNLLRAAKVEGENCNYTHWMPLPAAPMEAV